MNDHFDQLFSDFEHQFRRTNKAPEMRSYSGLGWTFVLSLTWAVSAVLMVSVQTMYEFYHAKIISGMDGNLALVGAAAVLFAVEGGLVIGAAIRAQDARDYNRNLVLIAIGLCVLISISAGVNSSIGIIPNLDPAVLRTLRIALVFALGVAGSLVAWASGEVLGAQIAKMFVDRESAHKEYQQQTKEYEERLRASWAASPEYVIAKAEVKIEANSLKREMKQADAPVVVQGVYSPVPSNGRGHSVDYRLLSEEEKLEVSKMTTRQIMEKYGMARRTAQDWRSRSRTEFADAK